jgi:putative oxidoreductase
MKAFLSTDRHNSILAVQRAVLALVMFPHGAQKLLGWFGGYGFSGTMGYFTGSVGLPAPIALLVILGESIGALLLLAGLGTRLAAFGISAIMLGAVLTSHASVGFFMNWAGTQAGEGFEYHLLALALSVPLVIAGGGRYAVDSWVRARLEAPRGVLAPQS